MSGIYATTTSDLATTASVHIPWLLFRNPSNSNILAIISTILNSTTVSSGNHIFRTFIGPTVTSPGVLLLSVPLAYRMGISPQSSICLVYSKPTVSANGNQFSTVVAGVTFTNPQNLLPIGIVLPSGYDLLITCRANAASLTAATDIYWREQ